MRPPVIACGVVTVAIAVILFNGDICAKIYKPNQTASIRHVVGKRFTACENESARTDRHE